MAGGRHGGRPVEGGGGSPREHGAAPGSMAALYHDFGESFPSKDIRHRFGPGDSGLRAWMRAFAPELGVDPVAFLEATIEDAAVARKIRTASSTWPGGGVATERLPWGAASVTSSASAGIGRGV